MPETGNQDVTADAPGHHIADGRNVIAVGGGHTGTDIFFAAVQMSRMPMCLTDPGQPDDPIIFCNQAFESLTGYDQHEILGRNCRFLQGEATDPAAVAEVRTRLREGRDVHVELLNYRKTGARFWSALFISPVHDTAGRLVYHFASQIDVTRRREAEAVLSQAQRMETMGSMASSLAHEFNNLMTIVLANLDRLGTETDPSRRASRVERAMWGASRAARLTDQMLSFARRRFDDDETIDVNETLAGFDTILDQMAGTATQVRLDLSPQPLTARLDPSQLEMALLNLVRNASDAAPAGGEIVITTRSRPDDASAAPAALEIAVADTGAGMTPDVARRATEPFFTTKDPGKGTGLGLSMVKRFVEGCNGTLELDTKPDLGTTVRLVFPVAARGDA